MTVYQNVTVTSSAVTRNQFFWKLNGIFSLNIFNDEKSVGGHVKKSRVLLFFN